MHAECAVFLIRGRTVLLGRGPTDRFLGPPTDRIGPLETPEEAAVRIVRNQTGFDYKPDHWQSGIVVTHLPDSRYRALYVYTTADFIIRPGRRPATGFAGSWIEFRDIRYDQMAPGCQLWVPHALRNFAFRIELTLGPDGQLIDHHMLA